MLPSIPTLRRNSWWLPLAAISAAVLWSFVTGSALTPTRANAATSIDVRGTVESDIYLDAAGCSADAVSIGELVPGTDGWKTAKDQSSKVCSIAFGTTNYTAGTTLSMLEDPASSAGAAMKCVNTECTGSAIGDVADSATEPAIGSESFGAQLLSAEGVASAQWAKEPAVHPVSDAASATCRTGTVGTGTCAFTWGAVAASKTTPGAYQARANLVVLAN